jgi:hypothetical protein
MAIVACPFCGKKVSSKAASCPHCGKGLSEVSPLQIERIARDKHLALGQSINNHAMISILLFLGSFVWLYFRMPEEGSWQSWLTYGVMGLGAAGYVISKVRMVMYKRK